MSREAELAEARDDIEQVLVEYRWRVGGPHGVAAAEAILAGAVAALSYFQGPRKTAAALRGIAGALDG